MRCVLLMTHADQKRHPRQQCSLENVFIFSGKEEADGCSGHTIGDQRTCSTFVKARSRQKDGLSAREQRPRVLCAKTIRHVKGRQHQGGVAFGSRIENHAIEVSLRHGEPLLVINVIRTAGCVNSSICRACRSSPTY